MSDAIDRCSWAGTEPLMVTYHDDEWGMPVWDDGELFDRLMLECFQAGLSWRTILNRRQTFYEAFHGWDAERIAAYGPDDIARLMADPGIIRNRLKVEGSVKNAKAFLKVREDMGSFADFVWSFTGGGVLDRPAPVAIGDIPATTPESDAMSKALKKLGFTFVGSTIIYAFMQSAGLVNDHMLSCPARERCIEAARNRP
ncbi:DNA-3-methyladenine glycosylase I [soil metagenome]